MRLRKLDLRVLGAFHVIGGTGEAFGLEIMRAARIGPARLYPSLERLEKAGWLFSYWSGSGRRVYVIRPAIAAGETP